jgi:DNA-binding transcriptional LysR family regulator
MINLRHVEVFHAIMVAGSVTGAARILNVSQPAVTAVLKHCESQIKFKLFERSGGRLKPTKEAEALFPNVAAIFGRVDALDRMMQDLAGGRLGSLAIGAAFPIANGFLAQAVASFMRGCPGLRVTLQSHTSPQVIRSVVSREVELGIVHVPVTNAGIETEILTRWSIDCAMAADHPLAGKDEVQIEDLADLPIITYLPQIVFRPFIDRAFSEAGISPTVVAQVSIALTGIVLASHGVGVALVDTMLLQTLDVPGIAVRKLAPRIESQTLLLSIKDEPQSVMASAFVRHLKQHLAAHRDEGASLPRRSSSAPISTERSVKRGVPRRSLSK